MCANCKVYLAVLVLVGGWVVGVSGGEVAEVAANGGGCKCTVQFFVVERGVPPISLILQGG